MLCRWYVGVCLCEQILTNGEESKSKLFKSWVPDPPVAILAKAKATPTSKSRMSYVAFVNNSNSSNRAS